ncbi:Vacuolar protein sorting-associated protein 18 homolog-like Protein [Tribolium castaneum]|uniref:Vacuolar protein sorting-associated protein 18 homolog n=1 Tax=Tribolium castaneum TaxID=7070 RepID=D6WXT3_TRICA|nr:PREDICTED: vacuolar protein sorting-associated protein 18 homolog isoform X2 [Tribolium castaneum]EFA08901.1 Vacuolar protein sorting-associated protein 18 homolog-like Protein [Tribolium castaneum]|eukprot:XP_008196988.1 PREDICTED: vacuolar protein sorting-associated protein 18 homolog isoform X2 [Tribolium castaneum]
MTSLFDQFEQASTKMRNNNFTSAEMSSLGYINMTLDQDAPIFSKTKKDFTPPDKITHVAISNKQLAVALGNNTLFRMNLHNPQQQDEISLSKYTSTCRLTNLFMDPTGNHLLLTFAPKSLEGGPELLYLARKSNKLKTTTKFRGHEFTDVAWNHLNESESTTGPILLGTSKGLIFETEIVLEGDKFFTSGFSSSFEQYWRQVFDIGKGSNTPITGLDYHKVLGTDKYIIFAATPTRLYYFTGRAEHEEKPLLQQVFNRYLNIPEKETYLERDSSLKYSRLKFWSENLTVPNAFAWMTEKGVTYCQFESGFDDSMATLKAKTRLIEYPKPLYEDYSALEKFPIALALTEFHVLLAYTDAIKGVCLLNEEVVYEDNYNEAFGKLVNIVKDGSTGEIWAVTENAVFRFKVTKEERNVWQIFCENQQFDLAKKYSRGNEAFYNQVLIKEADMLFNNKQYELSAQRYAETQSSFEEICLKFIQVDQQDSLKIFLRRKLDTLKPQDKTQITMIVLWVVELYLSKLEEKRLAGLEQSAAYLDIQKEFEVFLALTEVSDCIKKNKSTIYELMASHGDKSNLIKLTIVNKDFEQLIRHHIYKNSFHEALEVLKSQNKYELYYQFAPILMQEVPKYTVKALIEQGKRLLPVRLLPALVTCEGEFHAKEVMKYLEFCTDKLKNTDRAIHNFLLSLYAKHDKAKLMQYFTSQGQELSLVNYDVHFALRLCQDDPDLKEACVHLSGLLGLWESAVELALTDNNLKLAKQLADMPPEEDVELRKKLWLKIAQHVVSGKDDIQQAMEFLKQCDLIRIEDILPFFSDFVTIDHFKEAICSSLKEYNQHIQDLKDEMEEATKSAQLVREEIQSFRNRYTFISSEENCEICNGKLMVRPFYMFPCQHKFHTDCLMNELNPLLGPAKKNKLADLERQLKILNTQANVDNVSTGSGMSAREIVKSEIDNIVASECLFCGENMIRNIDKPFIEDYDYERIAKEWE